MSYEQFRYKHRRDTAKVSISIRTIGSRYNAYPPEPISRCCTIRRGLYTSTKRRANTGTATTCRIELRLPKQIGFKLKYFFILIPN